MKRQILKVELKAKLKLPRVEGGGRAAVISAAAAAFVKCVYARIKRICRGLVKPVEKIKHLADQIEAHSFAESDLSRNTDIG